MSKKKSTTPTFDASSLTSEQAQAILMRGTTPNNLFSPEGFETSGYRDYDISQYNGLIGRYGGEGLININPSAFQDTAAENQGAATQLAKGLGRAVIGTGLKTLQGLSMVGSAAYRLGEEVFDAGRAGSGDAWGDITNNAFVNALFEAEESLKDSEALRIFKPTDWDDRSIWQQIGSTAFWSDEIADAASFMASSMIQAGAIGKLGIGARITSGLSGRIGASSSSIESIMASAATQTFKTGAMGTSRLAQTIGKLTPQSIGKGTEFLATTAALTANEALFEARDTGEQMQIKLLNDLLSDDVKKELGISDVSQLSHEEQKEIIEGLPEKDRTELLNRKGQAMSNTFKGNMYALMFSNAIELAAINKIIGKGYRNILNKKSSEGNIGAEGNILDNLENLTPQAKRFWNKGSATRAVTGSMLTNMAAEGLYEENIQNAIQNISLTFDGEGTMDYIGHVFDDMVTNTFAGDKDTWKSIVTGAIVGAFGGAAGGYRGWKDDRERTSKIVEAINNKKDNFVNILGSLYNKDSQGNLIYDEGGNPEVNEDALLEFIANQKQVEDMAILQDIYTEQGASEVADLLRNELFAKLALSYVEAGLDSQLDNKVNTLEGLTEEQLDMLGMEQELNESTEERQASIARHKNQLKLVADNVKRDYSRFKRIIPEENQAALNQAVKYSTRIKGINELLSEKGTALDKLKASQGSFSINDINIRTRRIKELTKALKSINKNESPRTYNEIEKRIKRETESLNDYKEVSRDNLWNDRLVRVPSELSYIREESRTEDFRKDLNETVTKQVQLEVAKEQQTENLNNLLENATSFNEKLIERLNQIAEQNERKANLEEEIRNLQPGDNIELTDSNGNSVISQVRTSPGGSGLVLEDGTNISSIPNTYDSIKRLNEAESAEFQENQRIDFRNRQLGRRINLVKNNIANLRNKYFNALDKAERANKRLDVLRNQLERKNYSTSEAELNREIEVVEELLDNSQAEAATLKQIISDRYDVLDEIQSEINERSADTNIESLQSRVNKTKSQITELEKELNNESSFLRGLIQIYNSYKEMWRRFFPNKTRDFRELPQTAEELINEYQAIEEDFVEEPFSSPRPVSKKRRVQEKWEKLNAEHQEWSKAEEELNNNKEELKSRIKNLEEITKQKEQLQRRLNLYETELREYEALLRSQENFGELYSDTASTDALGPTPSKGKPVLPYGSGPRKDITTGLFTTTGNFNRRTPQSNAWFKFTQSGLDMSNYRLAVVTINDPIFGLGKENDVFSHEPKEFQNENNVKVVIVNATAIQGQQVTPFRLNGELISTSLIEPKDSFEDYNFQDGTPMFTNKLNLKPDQLEVFNQEYKSFIESAKEDSNKGERKIVPIGERSIGFINKITNEEGNQVTPPAISAREAFGKAPKVRVSDKESYQIKGVSANTELGSAFVYHDSGTPIPASVRNINEVEARALLEALKEYAGLRKKGTGASSPLLNRIQSILYLDKSPTNSKHSTFFVRGAETFVFGDSVISLDELIEGGFDQSIIEHLQEQRHQVSNSHLRKEGEYVSITGRTYTNYNSYLVDTNDRSVNELPLTFEILPRNINDNSQHQIGGMYLSFDSEAPAFSAPNRTPTPEAKVAPISSANTNNGGIVLDFDTPSDLNAEALANSTKSNSKAEQEKAKKEYALKQARKQSGPPADVLAEALSEARQETESQSSPTNIEQQKVSETPAQRRERLKARGARTVGQTQGTPTPSITPEVNITENVTIAINTEQQEQSNKDTASILSGLKKVSKPEGLDVKEEAKQALKDSKKGKASSKYTLIPRGIQESGNKLYTGSPIGSSFDGTSDNYIPSQSLYVLNIDRNNPNRATFEINTDEIGIRDAVNYPQRYITPVSEPQNALNQLATKITTVEKGIAEKHGDKWVVTKKAKVFYGEVSEPKSLARAVVNNYEKGDLKQEVSTLKRILGNDNLIVIVQGLIDGKDFGQVLPSGKILLSDVLTRGTSYHEAFHVVFDFLLEQSERDTIYNEYRQANPQFEGRSDLAVEEAIAEEFRDFALLKENKPLLQRIFDRILNLIDSALKLVTNSEAKSAKDKLFNDMLSGRYGNKSAVSRPSSVKNMQYSPESDVIANEFGVSTQRAFFEGMTYDLMSLLRENGFNFEDLNNFQNNRLGRNGLNEFNSIFEQLFWNNILTASENNPDDGAVNVSVIPFMEENQEAVIDDFKNYLKRFNIVTREDVEGQIPLEESEKSKDTLGIIDAIEYDPKAGSPNIVKLALASLPSYVRQNGTRVEEKNELGLPKLSDYRSNMAILFNELAGLETLEEMRDKIISMSSDKPEFVTLLDILNIPRAGALRTSDMKHSDIMLQNKFRETFDKAYYTYNIQKYNEGGESYLTDGNTDRIQSVIREKWRSNFIRLPEKFKKFVNGYETFNGEAYKAEYSTFNESNIIDFYKNLGIEFTYPERVDKTKLVNEAPRILSRITATPTNDLFSDELGIRGWVSSFIREEVNNSLNNADNQHITSDGKTVYSVSLNNMLTIAARKINKGIADYLTWNSNNLTGNANVRNSVALKRGWKVKVEVIEGSNAEQQDIDGQKTSKLSRTDTIIQQIVSIMNDQKSVVPFLRQADRGIEYGISFENNGVPVKLSEIGLDSLEVWRPIIQGYLADELLTSYLLNVQDVGSNVLYYKDKAKDLRIFKGIFNKTLTKDYQAIINNKDLNKRQAIESIDRFIERDEVKVALNNFMSERVKRIFDELVNSEVITKVGDNYINSLLPSSIIEKKGLSREAIEDILSPFARAFFIGNMEQTKLFTGDVAFYKQSGNKVDFFKRTSGLGGTGRTLANDLEYIDSMDEISPREDKPRSQKISSWVFNDNVTTSNLYKDYLDYFTKKYNETQAKKMLKPYKGYDEADAQGYITVHAYKDMLERAGQWSDVQESIYRNKLINNLPLTAEESLSFPPLKPQYFGPQTQSDIYVPTFYKLSLMPLIPSVVQGRQLDRVRRDMESNGIDMSTFLTGNKVGNSGTSNFYNEDGTYNSGEKTNIELDWDFMKIQLDMSPETKRKVTFGTQFRKLVLSNITGKKLYNRIENGKEKDDTKLLMDKYNNLIKKLASMEMQQLIDRLEVKFTEDGATLNVNNLSDLLRNDAFRNNAPKNVIDDINHILSDFSLTNDVYTEAMITRKRMENLLMGMVNDGVIRNKMSGDMFVQGAVSGFESNRRVMSDNEWYSDGSTLRFYEYDGKGTKAMEVLLPHRFKEMYGKNIDIANIDPKLLEIIGFRIPTQGLNSIEVIKIKGFLPKEAGNLVVLPSEIVAKAGSDFDIDKLTVFLNNYRISRDWRRLQKDFFENSDQRTKNFIKMFGSSAIKDLEESVNQFGEELLGTEQQYAYEQLQIFLRETEDDYNTSLSYEPYNEDNPTISGLQNEIIATAREIVSAPENFDELISPISAELLQEQANYISNIRGDNSQEVTYDRYFDFDYLQTTREDFLTGKDGVAIAALNLVHHTMSQQAELSLKSSNSLIKEETQEVSNEVEIWLPVNRNADNSISLSEISDVNGKNNILDTISAFLNGFVDIAKDPFLKIINATSDTANTYLMLIRAGVPLGHAVRFMNQPIIVDYINAEKINKSISVETVDKKLSKRDLEDKVKRNYPTGGKETNPQTVKDFLQSATKMEEAIKTKQENNADYNSMQHAVLLEYLEYEKIANELSTLMRATNADTAGAGASLYMAEDYLERYNEAKGESIFNNVERFETDTFLGAFNEVIRDTIKMYSPLYKLLKSPFALQALSKIKSQIKQQNRNISSDNLNRIMSLAENELISYVIQNSVNERGLSMSSYIQRLFKGERSLPKRIATLKQENPTLANNLLIKELTAKLSTLRLDNGTADAFDNLTIFSKRLPTEIANDITSAWEELFTNKISNADTAGIARELFDFALIQSSLNRTTSEFLKYAPTRFTGDILNRYIQMGMEGDISIDDYIDKFYRNNSRNKNLVPKVRSSIMGSEGIINLINEQESTLTAIKNTPYVKTWHKEKGSKDGFYFRLWKNTGNQGLSNTSYETYLYEEVAALNVGNIFKYYGQGVQVREEIPEVKQEMKAIEEAESRQPKTLEEKKIALSQEIDKLNTSDSNKRKLKTILSRVNNETGLNEVKRIICNI